MGNASGRVRKRLQKQKNKRRCYKCRRTGHLIVDCPDTTTRRGNKGPPPPPLPPPPPQTPTPPTATPQTGEETDGTMDIVTKDMSMVTVHSEESRGVSSHNADE
ncbi:unnamed protein product [Macrosiphum euphorbiae]|uniref:CCHC-type domain-containing protein n=1 Tax=Macrosiphum euphorbiae TaxID=13131 RepID=A0AAV0WE88_9HEMI|nr:unnamed protein product [Macrosiphum euphorbiae]